ncbi:MAG: magnesium transporter, partial [Gammaproteobacteria bacterium]
MTDTTDTQTTETQLELVTHALDSGDAGEVRDLLGTLHSGEIADLIESVPHGPREQLWELVAPEDHGETLVQVNDEVRAGLIDDMDSDALVAATEGLDADDLADLIRDLPGGVIQEVLGAMDQQNRDRLISVLYYPEDSAGGLMNVDVVTVRADVTLDAVLRYLRLHIDIPETTDSLFVVDRDD